jgi:hypothetical protein
MGVSSSTVLSGGRVGADWPCLVVKVDVVAGSFAAVHRDTSGSACPSLCAGEGESSFF